MQERGQGQKRGIVVAVAVGQGGVVVAVAVVGAYSHS